MGSYVRTLDTKSDDPSSITRTLVMEEQNQLIQVVL